MTAIVGQWAPPPLDPSASTNLPHETPTNMQRWEAWCRASVIDFELMSKLGFHSAEQVSIRRHLNSTPADLKARLPGR